MNVYRVKSFFPHFHEEMFLQVFLHPPSPPDKKDWVVALPCQVIIILTFNLSFTLNFNKMNAELLRNEKLHDGIKNLMKQLLNI